MKKDCCAVYTGTVYVSDVPLLNGYGINYGIGYGGNQIATHIGRSLGNTPNLTIDVDYPTSNTFRRGIPYRDNLFEPNSVTVSMSLSCDSPKNKELAFSGDYKKIFINENSVTDEVIAPMTSFNCGDFIAFSYPIVDLTSVEIKRSDTNATLVLGQDYFLTDAGIKLNIGFDSGVNLLLSYDYAMQSFEELETFIKKPQTRGLFFTGTNVQTKENLTLTFGQVEFNPVASIEYLEGQFLIMNITANVIPIEWSGSGLSDYFVERRF